MEMSEGSAETTREESGVKNQGLGSAGRGFDDRTHGAFGFGHAPIRTIGLDLAAPEFRRGQVAGKHHGTARGIHLFRVTESLMRTDKEEALQHLDYVFVGVLVVIQKDNIVEGREFILVLTFQFWDGLGTGHRLRCCVRASWRNAPIGSRDNFCLSIMYAIGVCGNARRDCGGGMSHDWGLIKAVRVVLDNTRFSARSALQICYSCR